MPPVRETRHLWVGNIPDSVTEEKLIEHFERYGRIDSVKILAKRSSDGGQAAFVDFVDIRCAIKAHQTPNRLGDRELRTDYNEPASTTLTRTHIETSRRYERGGRGPGDEGYSSRQTEAFQASFSYKSEPVQQRREYDRGDTERTAPRASESSGTYRQSRPVVTKGKDSDSGQSGSGTALSGSGSDSSDSGDSDSDSDTASSASEPSRPVGPGAKKPTALMIRNLSSRSADATIREGLYHEFKKHGEVGQIKVSGRENNRYAIVYFRRHEEVMKAIESCRGKMFLGLEMDLAPYDDDQYDGNFHRYRRRNEGGGNSSFNAAEDVFLFNATRTIFVGNIERNTTSSELKRMFERYGEIVDVDIKKQGSNGAYAFIQYLDITHAVEAKKQMNRASSGRTRLKIGFGKGMPTSTIWIGGLIPTATEQMIERHFQRYGRINRVGLDHQRSYAMVTFDSIDSSTLAHNEAKDRPVFGKRIRVDYASRESQHFFYDHLARTGQGDGRRYEPSPPPVTPPSYRQRGSTKGYEDAAVRSRSGGMKQDSRGSKYHSYDHGYERGPGFTEGGRGRGHYEEYYRSPRGGYESDDFGQELREYNVTRERERERERAREREQDRRQEPPRRRHRDRHDVATESDGERYYSRGEHSEAWPGDSGKDRASRESSFEPREDVHRKSDKKRDGDKRRAEDKKGHVKRFEGQSEDDIEPPADRSNRRDKVVRKKIPEIREDGGKGDFYPANYEKSYGNGDSKEKELAPLKRKVKVEKDFLESTSAEDGKLLPEEITVKIDNVKEDKDIRVRKEERSSEKVSKKLKHKEGKKKRKHKKSPEAAAVPAEVPPQEDNAPGAVDSDGPVERAGFEPRDGRHGTRVEKRSGSEVPREEKKPRRSESLVVKSVIVDKNLPESSDKDRRDHRQDRRPKSPSPEEMPEERVSRKRARTPERDVERPRVESSRAKNAKHADRRSNGGHYEEANHKQGRVSREATPPPPPPPPPPYEHTSKPKAAQDPRQYASKDGYNVLPTETSPTIPQPKIVEQPTTVRPSREPSMFQPYAADAIPSTTATAAPKHETRAQALSHPSPTNSPAPAQTGSSTVPNSDDTLMELLRRHPVMWQGLLGLKNDSAAIQMHYVSGNSKLAEYSLPKPNGGTGANGLPVPPVLRIAQRMRMEASQLEGVTKRMQLEKEHCLLLALPCGRDPLDVHAQTRALKNGFIAYLQQKLAAGIINIAQPGSQQASFVLHVFPPCEFSHSHLSRVAPNLLDSATDSGHLMVVVATV